MSTQWPTPAPFPATEPSHPLPAPGIEPAAETLPGVPEAAPPWWRRSLSALLVAGAVLLKFGKAALLLLAKAKVLFNLLPIVPLDGGRAMAALSPTMWLVGLFALAVPAFTFPNPIIFIILLLGGYETYKRWKQRKSGDPAVNAFYRVKRSHLLTRASVAS